MVCRYTSKTSTEIKVIIANLEDAITDANSTGSQRIDYNGTEYEVEDFIKDIQSQIDMWLERLCWAEEQEGTRTKQSRFSRFEGYC